MTEKRQFPRIHERARLTWRVTTEGNLRAERSPIDDGLQINISGGGICFFAEKGPTVGAILAVQLELPGYPSAILALARVVWTEPVERDGRPGADVGAEFHWVGWDSNFAQQQIATFVRTRLAA